MPATTLRRKMKEAGLGRAFWLLILGYSFQYDRWHIEIPPLGYAKIPGLLTYGFLIWWFIKGDNSLISRYKEMKYVFIFMLLMAVSIFWAKHLSAFWTTFYFAINFFSIILPTAFLVNSWEKLIVFFKYWAAIHLVLALIVIRNGGVGSGSFLYDENDVSLCLSMGIPYAFYLLQIKSLTKKWKLICWASLLLMVVGVVVSFSRGGFLGLLVVLLSLLWFSKHRIRNMFSATVAGLVLSGIVLAMLPPGYVEDMESINDPNDNTRVERLRSWEIGWLMFLDNPVLGVGAKQFAWNVDSYQRQTSYWISEQFTKSLQGREAHSLYFSLIPDMGIVGTVVFCLLIGSMTKKLFGIRREYRRLFMRYKKPSEEEAAQLEKLLGCELLAKAMLIAMAGFFVSGAFISVLYYPHIWFLAAFVAVLDAVARPIMVSLDCEKDVVHR